MSNTVVKLSKPLRTHEGELNELTLNAPTARSFINHGEPFKVRVVTGADDTQRVELDFDNKIMAKFLSDMIEGKVDDLIIGSLTATDFMLLRMSAANIILGVAGTDPL
jgi:hypothetical protein